MADRAKHSKVLVHFSKCNENAAKCNISISISIYISKTYYTSNLIKHLQIQRNNNIANVTPSCLSRHLPAPANGVCRTKLSRLHRFKVTLVIVKISLQLLNQDTVTVLPLMLYAFNSGAAPLCSTAPQTHTLYFKQPELGTSEGPSKNLTHPDITTVYHASLPVLLPTYNINMSIYCTNRQLVCP